MLAVALCAHLALVQMQLVHVRFSDVLPLFTLPEYVLGVRFSAVAGVVCACVIVDVFGVFKSVWWSDAAHEDGLHSAKFSAEQFCWLESSPVYKPFFCDLFRLMEIVSSF